MFCPFIGGKISNEKSDLPWAFWICSVTFMILVVGYWLSVVGSGYFQRIFYFFFGRATGVPPLFLILNLLSAAVRLSALSFTTCAALRPQKDAASILHAILLVIRHLFRCATYCSAAPRVVICHSSFVISNQQYSDLTISPLLL